MDTPSSQEISPLQQALQRCDALIQAYQRLKRNSRIRYQTAQILAIVFSGLTPVLILWTDLPKPLQALPAALAAIAAGLNGVFQWKENYIRFAFTVEAIQSERVKFKTRTTREYAAKLAEHEALENFVTRVETLVLREVSDWRAQMLETPNSPALETAATSQS